MAAQYLDVLYDPGSFFDRGDEADSPLVPVVVALVVGAVGGLAVWLSVQQTAVLLARLQDGAGQQAGTFATVGGAVGVVVALVMPFVAWLVYAGLFHGIGVLLGGEGSFWTTLVYTGWGLAPKLIGSAVNLGTTWVVLGSVQVPTDVTMASFQRYQQAIGSHPANLVGTGVGVLVLLWSAFIWVSAVEHAIDLEREDAMIAVGIPVAIALVVRVGTTLL